jgi:hypothetical protein
VQRKVVRRLARDRLVGPLQQRVLDAVDAAQEAQRRRNEVVHQEWLLRSVDVMRPVSELSAIPPAERTARLEEWQREAIDSPDWQRAPRDTVQVVPAQRLGELKAVERELFRVGELVQTLTFRVAAARVDGASAGYGKRPATNGIAGWMTSGDRRRSLGKRPSYRGPAFLAAISPRRRVRPDQRTNCYWEWLSDTPQDQAKSVCPQLSPPERPTVGPVTRGMPAFHEP